MFLVARAFLREVERSGRGSLVLVGSTAGVFGEAGHADYAAAKSAVLGGLLLSLKNEIVRIAPHGRVNAVAPGWTESPMTRGLIDPERVAAVSRTMALRKVAQPEDVARQVVVLASDALSGHVTGQVVVVAGGMEGRTVHEERLRWRTLSTVYVAAKRSRFRGVRARYSHSRVPVLRMRRAASSAAPSRCSPSGSDCRQSPVGSRSGYRQRYCRT